MEINHEGRDGWTGKTAATGTYCAFGDACLRDRKEGPGPCLFCGAGVKWVRRPWQLEGERKNKRYDIRGVNVLVGRVMGRAAYSGSTGTTKAESGRHRAGGREHRYSKQGGAGEHSRYMWQRRRTTTMAEGLSRSGKRVRGYNLEEYSHGQSWGGRQVKG